MSIDKVVQNRLHDLKIENEIEQRKIRYIGDVAKEHYPRADEFLSVVGFDEQKTSQIKAESFYSLIENVLNGDYLNNLSDEYYSEHFTKMKLTENEITPEFSSVNIDQDYTKFAVALGWAQWVPSPENLKPFKQDEKHSLSVLLRVILFENKYYLRRTPLGKKVMSEYIALENII